MSLPALELKKPVVAVQRAVAIMRHLGRGQRPAGVNELARALDIVPSTCLHLLRTLVHEGLVSVDAASKRYILGPALLTLARDMAGSSDFVREAQTHLDTLARTHEVTTVAAWLEGSERLVVVAKANAPSNFSINVNVGSRFPTFVSAIGACVAASSPAPETETRRRFDAVSWQNPPEFEKWLNQVEAVRERGYAIDRGHYLAGMTVVAAPVLDADLICRRALAAVGVSEQLSPERVQALGRRIKAAATLLSHA